jgi:hypothetical protein
MLARLRVMPVYVMVAILFAVARLSVFNSKPHAFTLADVFKDFAHLFLGGLMAWACCEYCCVKWLKRGSWAEAQMLDSAKRKAYVAAALILIEIVAFLWGMVT